MTAGKRILLVEDDFLNRRLLRKVLSEKGYEVAEAKNAVEALYSLSQAMIDVVVLDINLGEASRDGVSLGASIQKQFFIPFIYLTAYADDQIMERAISTQPNSYLTKPFKNADLLAAVDIAIRQGAKKIPNPVTVTVKDGGYSVDLPVSEIVYLESEGNYVILHTSSTSYKCRSTIKLLLQNLPPSFIQVHRAFAVNREKIEKHSARDVVVKGHSIPVSRNFVAGLQMKKRG